MNNTPKFNINYEKVKSIDLDYLEKNAVLTSQDLEHSYNPFNIDKLQKYNPIYKLFFELSEKNYNKISLNNHYQFLNMDTIINTETNTEYNKKVFIKYSPLIDPVRYMTGKYINDADKICNLPILNDPENAVLPKIMNENNSSYTDNFFCYLTSKLLHHHNFLNSVEL
jgi:hypothetical protein